MTASDRKPDAGGFSQADWDEVSDNPDLTDAELAALRPAQELPPHIYAALPKNRGGRPRAASPKVQLTLRIDRHVLEAYKASGAGWQTRINDTLARALDDPALSTKPSTPNAPPASGIRLRKGSDETVLAGPHQPFPPARNAGGKPSRVKKTG